MATSRREFFTEVGGIGMGGVLMATGTLDAADPKPQAAPPASMIFETVLTEGVAELSYLIGDKATGKAAVIDPRRDIDIYVELARKHKDVHNVPGGRWVAGIRRTSTPLPRTR